MRSPTRRAGSRLTASPGRQAAAAWCAAASRARRRTRSTLAVDRGHRQAAAVDGHRVADGDVGRDQRRRSTSSRGGGSPPRPCSITIPVNTPSQPPAARPSAGYPAPPAAAPGGPARGAASSAHAAQPANSARAVAQHAAGRTNSATRSIRPAVEQRARRASRRPPAAAGDAAAAKLGQQLARARRPTLHAGRVERQRPGASPAHDDHHRARRRCAPAATRAAAARRGRTRPAAAGARPGGSTSRAVSVGSSAQHGADADRDGAGARPPLVHQRRGSGARRSSATRPRPVAVRPSRLAADLVGDVRAAQQRAACGSPRSGGGRAARSPRPPARPRRRLRAAARRPCRRPAGAGVERRRSPPARPRRRSARRCTAACGRGARTARG